MAGPTSASGRIKVAAKGYDVETGTLEVVFTNEEQLNICLDDLSADIVRQLAMHGLSQKVGDSYSSVKGDVQAAFEAAKKTIEQLSSGEWRVAKAAGEGSGRVGELAEAIARLKNVDVKKAAAAVANASEDMVKAWRANASIKAAIAEIRAEKAAARAAKSGDDVLANINLG